MSSEQFQLISVKGDAYARGFQHGTKAKELVRENVKYYLYLWKTYVDLSEKFILNHSGKIIPAIENYNTEILEEMKGVADGADLPLEKIVALNSRWDFIWAKMATGYSGKNECTAIAAEPEVTSTKHMLIGQNWDYKPKVKDQCILLEIEQREKPKIIMHTEAGIIGQKGLNSAGLGLCVNALASDQDQFEPKVPFLVICREILNSNNLGDAIGAVLAAERTSSGNFLIAHAGGAAIDLESSPVDVGFIHPDNGVITHSNNFINLQYTRNIFDKLKSVMPDTLLRFARAKKLLNQKRDRISVETFKQVLSDHFNKPNSICRHIDTRSDVDFQFETLTSITMDLNDKTLYFTNGPPCENEYKEISLNMP